MTRLGATALPWPEPGADSRFHAYVREADLVVQATSAGMHGADDGASVAGLVPWPAMPATAAAYDLVYNPAETPFLRQARVAGHRAEGGLGMLVGQARAAIELWLGATPPREPLFQAAERALPARAS
jgi:shikimate dehydrogenase